MRKADVVHAVRSLTVVLKQRKPKDKLATKRVQRALVSLERLLARL